MQFKKLVDEDDAVSPVIGVILMVAITVILAAVIGTFVLGLGDQVQDTAPNAQIASDQGTESVEKNDWKAVDLRHTGGDSLQAENIDVTVDGATAYGYQDDGTNNVTTALWDTDEIQAGSSVTVVASSTNDTVDPGTDVYVVDGGDLAIDADGDGAYQSSEPKPVQLQSDDTVRVTWESSSGGSSSTLREYEVN